MNLRLKRFLLIMVIVLGIITLFNCRTVHADSITDVMNGWSDNNTPDSEAMNTGGAKITKTAGIVISVIIYVFFAMTAFTTACDLLYITVPPLRPLLYSNPSGRDNINNVNVYRKTAAGQSAAQWQSMANNSAAMAQQHMNNAQVLASQGDFRGAQHQMNMANFEQESANRRQRYANENATEQAINDANFVAETRREVNRAHRNNIN